MNSPQSKGIIVYVGADVSKDTIDISYHSDVKRISAKIDNETKAIKVFVKKMKVEKGATLAKDMPPRQAPGLKFRSLTLARTITISQAVSCT